MSENPTHGEASRTITLSQAVEGYLLYAHGRQLSLYTIKDYKNSFTRLQRFLVPADPPLAEIDLASIEGFFASLTGLSKKTLLNYHTALSALWSWAYKRRIVQEHVLRQYRPARPERTLVEIFTEEEVQKLLYACDRTPAYTRPGKRKCSNARPTVLRDKAIILTLLDSMIRVNELCQMLRSDTNLRDGRIKVMGKGDKQRWVPISPETSGAIWQYLASRPPAKPRYEDYVFLTRELRPMDRYAVHRILRRLGTKTGTHAHPHKFRHTGATQFLKNGGNVFALREILGHSTMTMVERYVHFAQVDIDQAHRRASPVYNWDLRL
jgi:site-specific recombinase XerD